MAFDMISKREIDEEDPHDNVVFQNLLIIYYFQIDPVWQKSCVIDDNVIFENVKIKVSGSSIEFTT